MSTLTYDQGTLLLDGFDHNVEMKPPDFTWDERVKSWRTDGFRYRSAVLWLRQNNIPFTDRARLYDPRALRLQPVTAFQLFDYQEQAVGACAALLPEPAPNSICSKNCFAADFRKTFEQNPDGWRLARADAVIPHERNEEMIPDFTLHNETDHGGREVHLEIVGFWTPEYLSRKIAKVKAASLGNLIIAVSKQLALSDAVAEELNVLWFVRKLAAADVFERVNKLS